MHEVNSNAKAGHQVSAVSILRVLESLRCGGILLDFCGRVLSFNVIALGCLGEGLVFVGRHLRSVDRATDHRLQCMIASALGRSEDPDAPLLVAVQRPCRPPLVVRAVRLSEEVARAPGAASVLLVVLDPKVRQDPSREMLTQAFALTRAETDVAVGILSGKTLAEIATTRGIKIGTVRAYTKAVFSKTQTRGQADLTGLLTRLSFVVAPVQVSTFRSENETLGPLHPEDGAQLPSGANGGRSV